MIIVIKVFGKAPYDELKLYSTECSDQIFHSVNFYSYSLTKRLVESVKTVLELWGKGLQNMFLVYI